MFPATKKRKKDARGICSVLVKKKKKKKNVIHRWDDYLNNIVELIG